MTVPPPVRRAVDLLAACLEPPPRSVTGTALVPAVGVDGGTAAGPIDAVRDEGLVSATGFPDIDIRLLTVQHTRCWVLALTFTGAAATRFTAVPGVSTLPDGVSGDTARATQYLLDRQEPETGVCLLGPPRFGTGAVHLLAITAAAEEAAPRPRAAAGTREGG